MRKLFATASVGVLAVLGASMVAAQNGAERAAATVARTYDAAGFDAVSVVGPHRVEISVGPAWSVRADGPRDTLEETEVEVEDGRLEIHPVENGRWERERWRDYEPATFYVTLPRISAASLVGSGDMRIDRVEGDEFAASVAGSGDLDVAALQVDDARFSIAGSGDLVARGSARRSRVSVAGSGNVRARGVTSDPAQVSIAGSGDAALTVESEAHVSIVGSGDAEIAGGARCHVSRVGSGNARCG